VSFVNFFASLAPYGSNQLPSQ